MYKHQETIIAIIPRKQVQTAVLDECGDLQCPFCCVEPKKNAQKLTAHIQQQHKYDKVSVSITTPQVYQQHLLEKTESAPKTAAEDSVLPSLATAADKPCAAGATSLIWLRSESSSGEGQLALATPLKCLRLQPFSTVSSQSKSHPASPPSTSITHACSPSLHSNSFPAVTSSIPPITHVASQTQNTALASPSSYTERQATTMPSKQLTCDGSASPSSHSIILAPQLKEASLGHWFDGDLSYESDSYHEYQPGLHSGPVIAVQEDDVTMAEQDDTEVGPATQFQPPSPAPSTAEELPAVFTKLQLTINPMYKVLICIDPSCQFVVFPQHLNTHMCTHHKYHMSEEELQSVLNATEAAGIITELSQISTPAACTTQIPGLQLHRNGYACEACGSGSTTSVGFKMQGTFSPYNPQGQRYTRSALQAFFKKGHLFPVVPDCSMLSTEEQLISAHDDMMSKWATDTEVLLQPLENVNEISPMLQVTQWHEYLKPFINTRQKLNKLLAFKKQPSATSTDPLCEMKDVLHTYHKHMVQHAIQCELDPLVCIENYGQQNVSSTTTARQHRLLCKLLYNFLVACARSVDANKGNFALKLDEEDKALIGQLLAAVQCNKGKVLALHKFLYNLGASGLGDKEEEDLDVEPEVSGCP
ncbi:hypothetical protein D9758_016493 [Tetrapyrgos nigripes]|uniref:Uncharacterized protein n=1 Tax=Tetrapyrgos nigripes TaxID=182062 RepID=A0A8H5CLU6_9AGAR|nr:hypothetical protein D9758_016493 [Tetrapyrgos nigripes]